MTLTAAAVANLDAVARGVLDRCGTDYSDAASRLRTQFHQNGVLVSTQYVQTLDRMAADAVGVGAGQMFELVSQFHSAEPCADVEARRVHLGEVLRDQIGSLQILLTSLRESYARPALNGLQNLSMNKMQALELASDLARRVYEGKVWLLVSSTGASARGQMSNTINVQGSVGAIHTGSGDQVVTTGSVGAAVDASQLVAALNELIACARDRGAPSDAIELLEDLRTEAGKERPNRLKVTGLLESVKSMVDILAAAPQAWSTAVAGFTALMQVLK